VERLEHLGLHAQPGIDAALAEITELSAEHLRRGRVFAAHLFGSFAATALLLGARGFGA
jgi:hypothetical protein